MAERPASIAQTPAAQPPQGHAAAPQAPGAQRWNSAEDVRAEARAVQRIALEHFTGRLAHLRGQAAAMGEGWPGDPANETMRLWLAIALDAGAGPDLPADIRAQIEVEAIYPRGRRVLPAAESIAEPHEYLPELARARDVALAKAEANPKDLRADQRARDLIALANALGAPGVDWSRWASSSGSAAGAKAQPAGRENSAEGRAAA